MLLPVLTMSTLRINSTTASFAKVHVSHMATGGNGEKRATEGPLNRCLSDGPRDETAKVAGSSPVDPAIS